MSSDAVPHSIQLLNDVYLIATSTVDFNLLKQHDYDVINEETYIAAH